MAGNALHHLFYFKILIKKSQIFVLAPVMILTRKKSVLQS